MVFTIHTTCSICQSTCFFMYLRLNKSIARADLAAKLYEVSYHKRWQ